MGPTWVLSAPDGPHVGPMNLSIRVVLIESDLLERRRSEACCHLGPAGWHQCPPRSPAAPGLAGNHCHRRGWGQSARGQRTWTSLKGQYIRYWGQSARGQRRWTSLKDQYIRYWGQSARGHRRWTSLEDQYILYWGQSARGQRRWTSLEDQYIRYWGQSVRGERRWTSLEDQYLKRVIGRFYKITESLEASRFMFRTIWSLRNLTGFSVARLSRCLSNFNAIY